MNSKNRVTTCQRGDSRLLDENFRFKPIKEENKIPNQHLKVMSGMVYTKGGKVYRISSEMHRVWKLHAMSLVIRTY